MDRSARVGGERPLARIEPGYRVGKLTVEAATAGRRGGYTVWRCRCACGGEILLDTRYLQRGTVRDCGCEERVKSGVRDLRGERFGKLTVVSYTGKGGKNGAIWACRCDCGSEANVASGQLLSGNTKSCGCLSHPPLKDYIGKRFGKLVVTGYAGKREGQHMWACRCDCGGETEVRQTYLQTRKTQSCGCLQATAYRKNLKLVEGTSVALLEHYQGHLSAHNTSGHNGVYRDRKSGKWSAQITFKGKTRFLGSYTELEDAVRARWVAQQEVEEFLAGYYAGEMGEAAREQAREKRGNER